MKSTKIGLLSLSFILTINSTPIYAAGNTTPSDYLPPNSEENPQSSNNSNNPNSIGDYVDGANSILDQFESQIGGTIGTITNTIGGWVETVGGFLQPINSIFQDVSSLANLVFRLIQLPSSVGGWWDLLINSVEGELDPCLKSPWVSSTPPIVYEPGWCMGVNTGSGSGSGSADNPSSLPDLMGPSANPIPYAGKKPWDSSTWDGNNSSEKVSPPTTSPTSSSDILSDSKGTMGIPDPSKARAKIIELSRDSTKNINDPFTSNPVVQAQLYGNVMDRAIIKTSTQTVFGEVGQERMSEELKAAQDAVAYGLRQATDAQEMDVTQDVMKQSIQVQALNGILLGSLVSANQQQRIDANMGNLALTNISRTLDESHRSDSIDQAISSNRLLSLIAQSGF